MRILFTNRSRLISWALDSEITHVAIEYRGLVYHSNRKGVHIEPLNHFLESSRVASSVNVRNNWLKLYTVVNENWNAPYDWLSFLHLGLRALLKKFTFGLVKIPKANIWNLTGMFICTEFVTEYLYGNEQQLTPEELFVRLRQDRR